MAKPTSSTRKAKDRWKAKSWYSLHAPRMFNYTVMGQTPSDDPDRVPGRTTQAPLHMLSGGYSQKHFMLKFRITEVRGLNAFTNYIGHHLTNDYLRSLTRRQQCKLSSNFIVETKDGISLRIKPIMIIDRKLQRSTMRDMNLNAQKIITDAISTTTLDVSLKRIFSGDLSKEIAKSVKSIYPIRRFEVNKIEVLNPSQLMENPPNEEELEQLLDNKEETETKPQKEEKEEVDYSSMKVSELKDILKERGLPVSGKKDELIERLSESPAEEPEAEAEEPEAEAEEPEAQAEESKNSEE